MLAVSQRCMDERNTSNRFHRKKWKLLIDRLESSIDGSYFPWTTLEMQTRGGRNNFCILSVDNFFKLACNRRVSEKDINPCTTTVDWAQARDRRSMIVEKKIPQLGSFFGHQHIKVFHRLTNCYFIGWSRKTERKLEIINQKAFFNETGGERAREWMEKWRNCHWLWAKFCVAFSSL